MLFKAAELINPDELQVKEVVFPACQGEGKEREKQQNTLNPNSLCSNTSHAVCMFCFWSI